MRYFDVFNGDADGICALHQLRLADPLDATLVTGLKRDIALLKSVPAEDGDVVTVLDISLDRNRKSLEALLARGVVVHYFDHHYAGAVPESPLLTAHLDDSGLKCTSALVNRYLRGRFAVWAAWALSATPSTKPRWRSRGRCGWTKDGSHCCANWARASTTAHTASRKPTCS
jgi:hypothetical protein